MGQNRYPRALQLCIRKFLMLPPIEHYRSAINTTAVRLLSPDLGELQGSILITTSKKNWVLFQYE